MLARRDNGRYETSGGIAAVSIGRHSGRVGVVRMPTASWTGWFMVVVLRWSQVIGPWTVGGDGRCIAVAVHRWSMLVETVFTRYVYRSNFWQTVSKLTDRSEDACERFTAASSLSIFFRAETQVSLNLSKSLP